VTVSIVVAHAANGVIGRDGDLPWRLPGDLKRFRSITTGGCVVMGRRTWESLPERFRPLPDRRNIVLSRDTSYEAEGASVFPDMASALAACPDSCFVIGGGVTYEQALPHADRVYATRVDAEVDGDTFFPPLSPHAWRCVEESEPYEENDHAYKFLLYERAS
jgi:dihydrofolate reductase